jgi:hypothetical protein
MQPMGYYLLPILTRQLLSPIFTNDLRLDYIDLQNSTALTIVCIQILGLTILATQVFQIPRTIAG